MELIILAGRGISQNPQKCSDWSAGGEAPVARLTKRTRGADADVLICVSVTLPHFFNNFSQKVPDFAASAALRAAIQSARIADSTRFLFL